MNNTSNTDEELDNFSYKELSKKVFLVLSAMLMIALATSWYLETELLDLSLIHISEPTRRS